MRVRAAACSNEAARVTDMILEKAEDLARLLLKQTGNLDRLEEQFAVVERALGLEAGPDMPWGERLARLRRNCGDAHPYAQGDDGHQCAGEKDAPAASVTLPPRTY
jgi:hypothetical protein